MHSAIEELDYAQNQLATTSAKLQVAKQALTATFDHLKHHSDTLQAAGAALQEHMKSNWRNHMPSVFDQVKHSTEWEQLSVEGVISEFFRGSVDTRHSEYLSPHYRAS